MDACGTDAKGTQKQCLPSPITVLLCLPPEARRGTNKPVFDVIYITLVMASTSDTDVPRGGSFLVSFIQ